MNPRVYTASEVAEQLQVTQSWIEEKARTREIPFTMLSGSYRFTDEHIDQIIAAFEEKPAARRKPKPAAPSNVHRLTPKTPPRLRKQRQGA